MILRTHRNQEDFFVCMMNFILYTGYSLFPYMPIKRIFGERKSYLSRSFIILMSASLSDCAMERFCTGLSFFKALIMVLFCL